MPHRPLPWILVLLFGLESGATDARAQHLLRDDVHGGDCEPAGFGVWSPTKRSCTLVGDLQGTLEIVSDGLTLDGGGHSLTPRAGDAVGVVARGRTGTTVENLAVRGFEVGVHLAGGSGNRIRLVTAIAGQRMAGRPSCGIRLEDTVGNLLGENVVESNPETGICLENSKRNQLYENRVRFNHEFDIALVGSDENTIARSTIVGGPALASAGIQLFASSNNLIVANDLDAHGQSAVWMISSDLNRIFFNVMTGNVGGGVTIDHGADNLVACNDSRDSQMGVDLSVGSVRNLVYMNNFFATDTARDLAGAGAANRFDQMPPRGGNHWEINNPFCVDANLDGFCDAPYPFIGNQDNLPWVGRVPWRIEPAICMSPALPAPPQGPSLPPPIEAASVREGLALYRALVMALQSGDVSRLEERLAESPALLDGDSAVVGRQAVLLALGNRGKCEAGRGRARPVSLPAPENGFTLQLEVEPCEMPRLRLIARVEKPSVPALPWRIRRLMLEVEPAMP